MVQFAKELDVLEAILPFDRRSQLASFLADGAVNTPTSGAGARTAARSKAGSELDHF
ncbi:hypothetical protein HFO74_13260 [Rhizobium laguerreae]|uniref:Transposase n=1 Tax=Rhizobium laguerreae TaxID=1076926 RepID=A0AB35FCH3_9HYPH|nr:hypothetical protein [Rhizobium laguerreae]MBY3064394.1 hypothetical protein [Rhizobium laguerreae]MBY3073858.1 hypothetical protein [Rhizobium laguerreae]MBY3142467.1 hypothetical protein [Rhizobium laguerreae]MBY3164897.1 hypothetical protein [Rhizobium laguerreae]MBY3266305.1 hypothetical protein [Rhizobium laguerreae]